MTKTMVLAVTAALMATGASAAPSVFNRDATMRPALVDAVRLVCDEDGRCYRVQGRRYVERRYERRAYDRSGDGYRDRDSGYRRSYDNGAPSFGFSIGSGRY